MNRDTIIEVTQADRDAAADMLQNWGGGFDTLWSEQVKEGERDDHVLAQAFARHRQAALTTCLPMIREELAGVAFIESCTIKSAEAKRGMANRIILSIRNHKFEGE